ncbi:MAG: DUF4199 family protein [Flavobacteriales bacterium]|nr:DUF4199 family protein [Flavobacteriales bacterium]
MVKNPFIVTLIGLFLAIAINVYLFATGDELIFVISRTMFANLMLVLTIVPVHEAIKVRGSSVSFGFGERIRSGMKPVALFTLTVALVTYILFKMFGDPLIGQRIMDMKQLLDAAVADGSITQAESAKRLEGAKQVLSPSMLILILLMSNMVVGFISSLLAAMLIRK